MNFVSSEFMPAALGAAGAVAANYVFSNYAPASMQTGMMQPVAQIGIAALLGFGVAAATDNKTGAAVGAGAMVVTLYELLQNYLQTGQFTQTQYGYGGGGGYYGGGYQSGMGRLMGTRRMGRFLGRGLGYITPARQLSC